MTYSENAQLALDTINRVPAKSIPICGLHIMEHSVIERLAVTEPGKYINDPHGTYLKMQENIGASLIYQYIATNPLTMGDKGYEHGGGAATTGGTVTVDGILIDSPEAVVLHIEKFVIPRYIKLAADFNSEETVQAIINYESEIQRLIGPDILKTGYGYIKFPILDYYTYGYENFFMAFALYPEIFEKQFKTQNEYFEKHNKAAVFAHNRAKLPLFNVLDHDIADSRGLLTGLKALERSWLPYFEKAIKPAVDAGFTQLWHCDGNLTELLPALISCGVNGFQGFQYEDGMDYVSICKMKDRNGKSLVIQAGISVTKELPFGSPSDVRTQLDFLVENGPETGLLLGFSSSCVPGTPFTNIETAIEGLKYYRKEGRK